MLKEKVEQLLKDAFEERPDLFLIEFTLGTANEINVIIDGDESVSVSDCIFVSRAIEHQLDREEVDFSLQVTSAGVGKSLSNVRQYTKNKGRQLEITARTGEKETGELVEVTENDVTINWQAREPKEIGKGKQTVDKSWTVPFENIKQAKVIITFN